MTSKTKTMNNFINYLLESGISIACFTALYLLIFQKEKSLQFNRFYLLGSVIISLVIPTLKFSSPMLTATQILPTVYLEAANMQASQPGSLFGPNSAGLLISAYIGIASFMIFLFVRKIRNIHNIMGRYTDEGSHNIVKISQSDEAFSFLDTIYIGDDIPSDRRDVILKHELAHVRQLHSVDIIFFELVACIFWINPLFAKIKRLAEINHEFLADDAVTKNGNVNKYIQILSQETLRKLNFSIGLHFYSSNAMKRIKMISDGQKSSFGFKHITPMILVSFLVFFFSCENLENELDEMSDEQAAIEINTALRSDLAENAGPEGREIFDVVEEQPTPQGGMAAFYTYVAQNMKYPKPSTFIGSSGKGFCSIHR